MDKVISVYERIVHIREMKANIEQSEMPEEVTAQMIGPLEDYANQAMDKDLSSIASEIIAQFGVDRLPEGRDNELNIQIKRSLTAIAGRIDEGFNISVRTGPIPGVAEDQEQASDEDLKLLTTVTQIKAMSKDLSYINQTGVPILSISQAGGSEAEGTEEPTNEPVEDAD